MAASNVLEMKRKSYKESVVVLLREQPELSMQQIVALVSTRTGLSHKRIQVYVDELIAEGRLPADIKALEA